MRGTRDRALATGAWSAVFALVAALLDAWLLERRYGITARPVLAFAELAVNALPLAVSVGAIVALARAVRTRAASTSAARWTALDLRAGGLLVAAAGARALAYGGGSAGGPLPALAVLASGLGLWGTAPRRRWAANAARALALGLVGLFVTGEAFRGPIAHARARWGGGAGGTSVVLIVVDTLRADGLSCHGHPLSTSPAIDALAEGGVRFARAYAQASWTLPATATIHTGLLPSSHGANARGRAIAPGVPTLAGLLRASGRRTGAFSENQIVSARYGFASGFEHFWSYWLPWVAGESVVERIGSRARVPRVTLTARREYPIRPVSPHELNWDARVTTDRALAWLDAVFAGDSSFFLYVHYMGPHGPYGPPEFLLDVPAPEARVADHPREMGGGHPIAPPGRPTPPAELEVLRTLYAADVRYVDREIGRLVERLGSIDGEVLVVVTSDHGEEFYEHGGWNHGGSVYEEIVRVPLVVAGAGVPDGRVVDVPVRHVDVVPTILARLGIEPPPTHGRDLLSTEGAPAVLVEGCLVRPDGFDASALVRGRDKLVRILGPESGATRLFDLAEDPGELIDRTDSTPARAESLRGALGEHTRAAAALARDGREVVLDPESARALRRLGYLQ